MYIFILVSVSIIPIIITYYSYNKLDKKIVNNNPSLFHTNIKKLIDNNYYKLIELIENTAKYNNSKIIELLEKTNNNLINKINKLNNNLTNYILELIERLNNNINLKFKNMYKIFIDKNEDIIINILLNKYDNSNKNVIITKTLNNINLKFYNYSLILTSIDNLNYNINPNNFVSIDTSNDIINPEIIYKINSDKISLNYNKVYLYINLYDIIIDKSNKFYKTIKTNYIIKSSNSNLELFLNNKEYYFINDSKLILTNGKEIIEIPEYTSELNNWSYTYSKIDKFKNYYY